MKLIDKTILITGGSSGIGLETARVLAENGNTVLICGRSSEKLKKAQDKIPSIHIFQCDISQQTDREKLADWVREQFPECSILINNAAITHNARFLEDDQIVAKAESEIQINLMAPIALTKLFLPILSENASPSVVNISTGLVYAPKATYPIYNATKAALHSFTQVLRKQLESTSIQVTEVFMSVVDTPWHNGHAPKIAITPQKAVAEMIRQMEKGKQEVRIDKVKLLYFISRLAPKLAFKIINQT